MEKRRVIVSELPPGVLGAEEVVIDDNGKPCVRDDGSVIKTVTPNTLKLTLGHGKNAEFWRARREISTPIPDRFIPALEKSGAVWAFDPPEDLPA